MSFSQISSTALVAFLLTPIVLFLISVSAVSEAQVMGSTNYRIQSDSVNFGGGFASSTNYSLESTAGEIATGDLTGVTFNLRAGYQQMVNTFISMSDAASVTMTPTIPGVSGGTANGSTTVTVTTDSSAGYQLTIQAENSPALQKGVDYIADYVPAGIPDFSFTTNSSDSHFGYTPSGIDVVTRFKDNGISCNDNTQETELACWDGLDITAEPIARRASANTPSGSTTTINFRVGVGSSVVQPEGVYSATTTLTALSL